MAITREEARLLTEQARIAGPDDPIYQTGLHLSMHNMPPSASMVSTGKTEETPIQPQYGFDTDIYSLPDEEIAEDFQRFWEEIFPPEGKDSFMYVDSKRKKPKNGSKRFEHTVNEFIRDVIEFVVGKEVRLGQFNLSGRGHEPRVCLDRKLAAVLRGSNIPYVKISGYGANYFFPKRVFDRAESILKDTFLWSPIGFCDSGRKVCRVPTAGLTTRPADINQNDSRSYSARSTEQLTPVPAMEPLLPPLQDVVREIMERAQEDRAPWLWSPIPDDAIPFSDPDPAVMDEVRQKVMEERRERIRDKGKEGGE